MTRPTETARLRALARLHGIQTSYGDVRQHRVEAPETTLRALLSTLGVPANTAPDCDDSWNATLESLAARHVDDVLVAWDGKLISVDFRTSAREADMAPELLIVLEDGTTVDVPAGRCRVEPLRPAGAGRTTVRRLFLSQELALPAGYHHLICTHLGRQTVSLLLSAPSRCYAGETGARREWGLFAPLYALRGELDRGAGSYADLANLARYTAHAGGSLVGTLPLLPCFCEDADPSPYLPVTRLLWSEFYVNARHIPFITDETGLDDVPAVPMRGQAHLVDYAAVNRAHDGSLRDAWRRLRSSSALQSEMRQFLSLNPDVSSYATFGAVRDALALPWRRWPARARDGVLEQDLYDDEQRRFREFEQWLAHRQMNACVEDAKAHGVGLYLDLPVGVHPDGYDTWRFREAFVAGAATGAPPDLVFTTGQVWGSPPLHPTAIRRQHYDYVRRYLSHHMEAARMLRIDHVMGLHRIFCIPEGAEPASGAYLRYRSEEWYAILSIESHRHRTVLVGEDLGLVPSAVHRSMSRHGLNRMFVLYYEMDGFASGKSPSPPRDCLAGLNTHDMPTFAAMWQGLDLRQQQRMGILNAADAPDVRRRRRKALKAFVDMLRPVCPSISTEELPAVLRCTLGWLGESRARYVVVNTEDLWYETSQQNVPGVGHAYPSWRRRAAMTLEEMWRSTETIHLLERLRDAMQRSRHTRGAG